MKQDFNDFRFSGLNYRKFSNKYFTMNRISEDGNKIVVKVGDNHLVKTPYGYALILDNTRVVFLKDWQVSQNYYGNEVLLNKEFWQVKTWGNHELFEENKKSLDFQTWADAAKEQSEEVQENEDGELFRKNPVKWAR